MTAKEFLTEKGIKSMAEQKPTYTIEKWLDEYVEIVLKIASEKAEIDQDYMCDYSDCFSINKESILNCLKDGN